MAVILVIMSFCRSPGTSTWPTESSHKCKHHRSLPPMDWLAGSDPPRVTAKCKLLTESTRTEPREALHDGAFFGRCAGRSARQTQQHRQCLCRPVRRRTISKQWFSILRPNTIGHPGWGCRNAPNLPFETRPNQNIQIINLHLLGTE